MDRGKWSTTNTERIHVSSFNEAAVCGPRKLRPCKQNSEAAGSFNEAAVCGPRKCAVLRITRGVDLPRFNEAAVCGPRKLIRESLVLKSDGVLQ